MTEGQTSNTGKTSNTKEAWDKFASDAQNVAGELRRSYRSSGEPKQAADVDSSLRQLGEAAEAFFESLGSASHDPEVRASAKRATRSFGSALAQTFREVGDELDKALQKKGPPA